MVEQINTELENCRRKRRYGSEGEAREAARTRMRMDPGAPELDVYECLWCRGWHLTRGRRTGPESRRR